MEDLVRHLVRHGIEFRTVARVIEGTLSPKTIKFDSLPETLPTLNKTKTDIQDYENYVETRERLVASHHCRAIYRAGGMLWRLAMESSGNFDDIIDSIMDGPSEYGALYGDYFTFDGHRYYDDCITLAVSDTISGCVGRDKGQGFFFLVHIHFTDSFIESYWPIPNSWMKKRWGADSVGRGCLMWSHRDEEYFQKRKKELIEAGSGGQPRKQAAWKRFGSNHAKFDRAFEIYCTQFLDRLLA